MILALSLITKWLRLDIQSVRARHRPYNLHTQQDNDDSYPLQVNLKCTHIPSKCIQIKTIYLDSFEISSRKNSYR